MLKLLNEQNAQQYNSYVSCEKDIATYRIDGKTFLLDCNNLNLWQTTEDIEKILDKKSLATSKVAFCEYDQTIYTHKGYVVFQATYACNLKCRYCFVEHHYCDHTNSINLETALKALDVYQTDWKTKGYNIGFFGGEPLMNWEFIYKLVQTLNKRVTDENAKATTGRGTYAKYHLTTNATLLTEEIAEFLAQNSFSLIVSIEGDENTHNESRPYRNQQNNSFKDTMRGLDFLKNAYQKFGKKLHLTLRSTFDRHGVDLVGRLEYLNNLCEAGYGNHVSVEPACLSESCASETMEDLTREELRAQFYNEYIKSAKWYAARKLSGKFCSYHHAESFINRIQEHKLAWTECGAGKGYVSVGPAGKVCACHREHGTVLGTLNKIDRIQLEKWVDNRLYARAKCPECPIRYICGGGCRCNSQLVLNNLKMPTVAECAFREMQIEMGMLALALLADDNAQNLVDRNQQQCNCGECKTTKPQLQQTQQTQQGKQIPICGLNYCLGKNCPFETCGKQTPENLAKAKKELATCEAEKK